MTVATCVRGFYSELRLKWNHVVHNQKTAFNRIFFVLSNQPRLDFSTQLKFSGSACGWAIMESLLPFFTIEIFSIILQEIRGHIMRVKDKKYVIWTLFLFSHFCVFSAMLLLVSWKVSKFFIFNFFSVNVILASYHKMCCVCCFCDVWRISGQQRSERIRPPRDRSRCTPASLER